MLTSKKVTRFGFVPKVLTKKLVVKCKCKHDEPCPESGCILKNNGHKWHSFQGFYNKEDQEKLGIDEHGNELKK